ncbi:MAG TPA: PDR/VanB family oxidoreductase [Ramlibacter sp.]|nr:PDR/VanB family oxidoreductase [Ramlibacter sp.]
MTSLNLVVGAVTQEAEAIRSFELARADGGPLPAFEAGAHIDVQVPDGPVRQYSLLNDDRERHRYVIAVLRDAAGRGGSIAMHDAVRPGKRIAVSPPRNAFALDKTPGPVALVAGGIGVTPLLSMARRLCADGREFAMHFATRSIARTPFRREISQAPFAPCVRFYHDDALPSARFDIQRMVDGLPLGAHVYLCGPTGFMDAVAGAVRKRADLVLRTEYFAAPVVQRDEDEGGDGFELVLARSGDRAHVPPGVSILEILRRCGVETETSCEQGICGTCMRTVLAGEIDHRDHYLSPGEKARGDRMLICVSRGKPGATLTIDL